MEISYLELLDTSNTLNTLSSKKLPQKISYAITRNLFLIDNDIVCYQKSLEKIFETYDEYLVKNDDGNSVFDNLGLPVIEKDHAKEYMEDIADLLNTKIKVDFYYVDESIFNYEDNEKYDSLSAQEIISLQSIICKKEELYK